MYYQTNLLQMGHPYHFCMLLIIKSRVPSNTMYYKNFIKAYSQRCKIIKRSILTVSRSFSPSFQCLNSTLIFRIPWQQVIHRQNLFSYYGHFSQKGKKREYYFHYNAFTIINSKATIKSSIFSVLHIKRTNKNTNLRKHK